MHQHYPNPFLMKERRKSDNLSLKSFIWMSEKPFAIHFLQVSCNVCPVAIPEICAQTQGSDYWQLIHSVSHRAGRHSACRLHNLPNQKTHGHQLHGRSICLSFLCLSMKKERKGCNHYIVQSVTFVLFGCRVFSIRWQGLRITKHKMDSRP